MCMSNIQKKCNMTPGIKIKKFDPIKKISDQNLTDYQDEKGSKHFSNKKIGN